MRKSPSKNGNTMEPGGAAVFLRDGIVGFKCQHSHCADRHAQDLFGPVNKKSGPGKFDKYAVAFVEHHEKRGEIPLFTGGRIYFFAGNRYVECEELPMKVREFFKEQGWSQSNNIVGNVFPIIQSQAWKDAAVFGPMPFWIGENRPFKNPKNIIAFSNGLLDLDAPDSLIPHSANWCSTVCLPFAHESEASCPMWEKFLIEIFEDDKERLDLVQEIFGYCLTQDTSLQKALVLVGKPRSGKGTNQRILGGLVGKDNSTGYSLERLATEFGASALVNKSVALVGEVELSANPQRTKIVEVLKSIIGEDAVSINKKYEAHFPSLRLPTRFVIASNTVPRLMDASGALWYRFLFVPFEISFVGREDIHLEEKLLAELPGIANWSLAGLKRLRAMGGKFTLGAGHRKLAAQYAAETSPIMAWVRSSMVIHHRADPGDLPPECITSETVSIWKSEAYDLYVEWCEANDVEPVRPAWFGRNLKTLIPKLQEGKDNKSDGSRVTVYRGFGIRSNNPIPDNHSPISDFTTTKNIVPDFTTTKTIVSDFTTTKNIVLPSQNGEGEGVVSGQSGHFDCFAQLLKEENGGIGDKKVVVNNRNALTALTQPNSTTPEDIDDENALIDDDEWNKLVEAM